MSATSHPLRALRGLLLVALLCLALTGCGPVRATGSPAAGACEVGATECLDIPVDPGQGAGLCDAEETGCSDGGVPDPDAEPCPLEGCATED